MKSSHQPNKQFGQNFLIDEVIIYQIIKLINPKIHEKILEIGPGLGAITADLLTNCKKLIAVEIDHLLSDKLQEKFKQEILDNKLHLINQDILKVDLLKVMQEAAHFNTKDPIISETCLSKNLRIVGNLPYNISSPLLFKLFNYSEYIIDLHFLLQKEFAARLVAKPNTKQYGKLSIMAQYHAQTSIMFNIPAIAFNPIPKVESSMVKIIPYDHLPVVANNYQLFNNLVTAAFCQRRKVLSNCLKNYCNASYLKSLGIDPILRPEQLSVADFVMISNSLAN